MEKNEQNQMNISVVIPAYNEEKYIKRTLESLQKQTLKRYEIIVVDNDSEDKTKKAAESFGVKVIQEKRKGCGFARRTGFQNTRGDIIVTTDADTILPKDWLSRIKNAFVKNPDVIAVGGPYRLNSKKYKRITNIIAKLWTLCDRALNAGNNIPGVNMAVLKSAYNEIGGFKRGKSYEDLDLSLRLKKHGKVLFLNDLVVTTSFRRYAQKGFFRTAWEYMKNYYKVRFRKKKINMEDVRETK